MVNKIIKMLIVEDDAGDIYLIKKKLSDYSRNITFEIEPTQTLAEALDHLNGQYFYNYWQFFKAACIW